MIDQGLRAKRSLAPAHRGRELFGAIAVVVAATPGIIAVAQAGATPTMLRRAQRSSPTPTPERFERSDRGRGDGRRRHNGCRDGGPRHREHGGRRARRRA